MATKKQYEDYKQDCYGYVNNILNGHKKGEYPQLDLLLNEFLELLDTDELDSPWQQKVHAKNIELSNTAAKLIEDLS